MVFHGFSRAKMLRAYVTDRFIPDSYIIILLRQIPILPTYDE